MSFAHPPRLNGGCHAARWVPIPGGLPIPGRVPVPAKVNVVQLLGTDHRVGLWLGVRLLADITHA